MTWIEAMWRDLSKSWVAAVCLLTVASAGCQSRNSAGGVTQSGPAPAVVVAKVVQKTVPVYGEFIATVQAETSVDIVARVEGVLKEMDFQEGQPVKKGQLLYVIDPTEYQAKVDSAKAALNKAESALKQAREQVGVRQARADLEQQKALLQKAQQDVARYKPLVAQRAVPQQDLDSAVASQQVNQANVDASEAKLQNEITNTQAQIELNAADVDSAKASLALAELNLSYCTIRAPFDGLIGRTKAYPGALVSHGGTTVLNTLAAIDPVQVTFGIAEVGYLNVRRHHPNRSDVKALEAEFILADDTVYPFKGHYKMAESSIDPKTGTLTVVLNFPNPGSLLRPNGFGRVRLVVDEAEDALLIPQKAAIEQQGGTAVLVVGEDNKVAQRTIVLGPQVESLVIVKQGLKRGDRVIVEGQQKARPGMAVTPTETALTAEAAGK